MMGFIKSFFAGFGNILDFNWRGDDKYPFAYPDKAITYDWDNIGSDIQKILDKERESGGKEK